MIINLGRSKTVDVPWSFTDRLVAWINPRAGVARLQSRMMMSAATGTGGYVGGKRDRRQTRNWRPRQTSANEDNSHDLPDLRSRSRDLVRNVPIATGAISTVVTSVVGDGLVLQSQLDREVLGLSEEKADAWQRQAEREFAIWAKSPDFTSRLNFDEMQEMALRAVLESGDILAVRRRREDLNTTYKLKLQFIEADRVSNPNFHANTASLVDGVEMDADGRPVKYHISSRHPDDTAQGVKREWKGYEAGSTVTGQPLILHLYKQLRPDQARGLPYLSPVIEAIKMLGDYSEAEARAAVVSAMFTVFVERTAPEDAGEAPLIGSNDATANVDAASEIQLGNGAIVDLLPGEKANIANPGRPNTAFDGFVTAVARQIGVGLDLPYELLLKSFTASYSASRAALEMAWQMFRTRRSWLAWKFCQPVYEWVITEAVATGRLSAPGFFSDPIIREAWLGSDWIGPSRIQLDPQKEASADLIDLNMGTKTRSQIIMERTGGSFEAKHAQLVKEENLRQGAGFVTANSSSAAMQPPQQEKTKGDETGEEVEMTRLEFLEALRAIPQTPAPVINVAGPQFHEMTMNVDATKIQMPEQKPPIVNVAAPMVRVAPPVVNVAAPIVNVHAPKQKKITSVEHDERGRIIRATTEEG